MWASYSSTMRDGKLHNKDHHDLHTTMHTEEFPLTLYCTSVTNSKIKCNDYCSYPTTNHRRLINNHVPHTIIASVTYLTILTFYLYFLCTNCGYQSRDRRRCYGHKLLHTDEKPIECNYLYLSRNIICFIFHTLYVCMYYLPESQLKYYKITRIAPKYNITIHVCLKTTLQRIT